MAIISQNRNGRIKFCEHSRIIFWWPVWLFGYVLWILNLIYGDEHLLKELQVGANWRSLLNLIYVVLILFVVYFTNIKTSAMTAMLSIAFVVILALLALMFLGSEVFSKYTPSFSIFMNARFFFTFSTGLLIIWAFTVFIVDQRSAIYLSSGTVTTKRPFQQGLNTMEGMRVNMARDDFPCHFLLGLGLLGDVELVVGTDRERERIKILNVANVMRKVKEAQRLIAESPNTSLPGSG